MGVTENFPRGGAVESTVKKKKSAFLFQQPHKPSTTVNNRTRHKVKTKLSGKPIQTKTPSYIHKLTEQSLTHGHPVLCCVFAVCEDSLVVSVPARFSLLKIQRNSIPALKHSMVSLKKLFRHGQFISAKVVSSEELSIEPREVNANLSLQDLKEGFVLQVMLTSDEDHVWMVDTGVNGVTGFVKNEEVQALSEELGCSLGAGSVLWARVENETRSTGTIKTISLTVNPSEIKNFKLNKISDRILLPGTRVDAVVVKAMNNGVEVKIQDVTGFVLAEHLNCSNYDPNNYPVGTRVTGVVIYQAPLIQQVYLCCNVDLPFKENMWLRKFTLITDVEVTKTTRGEIYVSATIEDKSQTLDIKGRVTYESRNNIQQWKKNFPPGTIIPEVVILGYLPFENSYKLSFKKKDLAEAKSMSNLNIGATVEAKVISEESERYLAKINNHLTCYIDKSKIKDDGKPGVLKSNMTYKCKIWTVDSVGCVHLTHQPTLLKHPSFTSTSFGNPGDEVYGVVSFIVPNFIRVQCFGVTFKIPETSTPKKHSEYSIGEVIKCYIIKGGSARKCWVSAIQYTNVEDIAIGQQYAVRITAKKPTGFKVNVTSPLHSFEGFLPNEHISDYPSLLPFLKEQYHVDDLLTGAIYLNDKNGKPIISCRESVLAFFCKNLNIHIKLHRPEVIPVVITKIIENENIIQVKSPVKKALPSLVTVSKNLLEHLSVKDIVFLKALSTNKNNQGVIITYESLNFDVNNLEWGIHHLKGYLSHQINLRKHKLGSEMIVEINSITTDQIQTTLPNGELGIIIGHTKSKKIKVGATVKTHVVFEDFIDGQHVVYLFYSRTLLIDPDQDTSDSSEDLSEVINSQVQVNIIFSHMIFLLGVISEGTHYGRLIFIPTKLNMNAPETKISLADIFSDEPYTVTIQTSYPIKDVNSEQSNLLIGSLTNDENNPFLSGMEVKVKEEDTDLKTKKSKKRSLDNPESSSEPSESTSKPASKKQKTKTSDKKNESDTESEVSKARKFAESILAQKTQQSVPEPHKQEKQLKLQEKKKRKQNDQIAQNIKKEKLSKIESLSLENAGGFLWDATADDLAKIVSNSQTVDEVEDEEEDDQKPKRKLTPAEKRLAAIEAERKIRDKEQELLQAESNPQSADHFERLVIAHPNDSKIWIQYMAFHLQATELEKARSVAKRALKIISHREEQERLNVWLALLNADNIYGTEDVFKATLEEALKCNDDYKINVKVLNMYAESNRTHALEQLVNTMLRKYHGNKECWYNCLAGLMKANLFDKARTILQKALNALSMKDHVNLISRFALLENQYGFSEEAQALFENLLTSYPARVDIWCAYVDMLAKSGRHDLVRNVLSNATTQKLPARKMKTLYTKWLNFEQAHGTEESIQSVKQSALEFVSSVSKSIDE